MASKSFKRCPLTSSELERLAAEHGTPLQLYDESRVLATVSRLHGAFKSQGFSSFRNFFAVKALPNPAVLALLQAAGCGFDCSSRTELQIVSKLGATGQDIMFTSNYTSANDLALAVELGAEINLDDPSLLDSLIQVNGGKCTDQICFRLNPGLGKTQEGGTQSNVLGGPGSKFGVAADAAVAAYKKAHQNGAKKFGIHMMCGSCVTDGAVEYWTEALTILADVCRRVVAETGVGFSFINIGGGLGINYREEDNEVALEAVAEAIRKVYTEEKLEKIGATPGVAPRLCMENGRFVTGPSGYLVTRCHCVKREHFGKKFYGVDACMAHLMRPGMYNSYHHVTIRHREEPAEQPTPELANVVGTLCENNDWFAKDRMLPPASVGDLFVIHDTGAHSHSMGFNYNGALRAPEILIRSSYAEKSSEDAETDIFDHVALIRERETFDVLFGGTAVPKDLIKPTMQLEYQRSTTKTE